MDIVLLLISLGLPIAKIVLFPARTMGRGGGWTIVGAALLTLLFIGSTIFTESITASKYPAYADYKRTTSMLVPLPRRRRPAEATA